VALQSCVDRYEASLWQTHDDALIEKIKNATVRRADLFGAGAVQLGLAPGDLEAHGCPRTGNGCTDVYAVSVANVRPARFVTWFQALAAARNSDKRLATNQEWQAAALGTPDVGEHALDEDCNTRIPGVGVSLTGIRENCRSDVGAFDTTGNLAEWTAEWVPRSTACPGWPGFSDDAMCLAGANESSGPGALIRGMAFGDGRFAGPFAVSGFLLPSNFESAIGFRAAR
jgi:formylglycine-generating enzyme required for sulfatase activity